MGLVGKLSSLQWLQLRKLSFTLEIHVRNYKVYLPFSSVHRQELSAAKRAQTVQKLSCILQQKPSGRQSPTFSSLEWLSNSLVNWIKKTGHIGNISSHGHRDRPHPLPPAPSPHQPCTKSPHTTKKNLQKLGNKSVQVGWHNFLL